MHLFHREPSILEATKAEQKEAIAKLISRTTLRKGYYLFLLLSVFIVTPGLLVNNASVIIGGMILAPLILPTLMLSLSLAAGSIQGLLHALRIYVVSMIIIVLVAMGMTFLFAQTGHPVTWIPERLDPTTYFFIALMSGVAAAFAWVKEDLSENIAGVAIAVSYLPPLCAVGVGLALFQPKLVQQSLLLFTTNALGIIIASFLIFWGMGFFATKKQQEKAVLKEERK